MQALPATVQGSTLRVLHVSNGARPTDGASVYAHELLRQQRKTGTSSDLFAVFDGTAGSEIDQTHFPRVLTAGQLGHSQGLTQTVRAAKDAIWSSHSAASLDKFLERAQYNVAHVHYIRYELTPSVLASLKRKRVKIVSTLHEYSNICPRGSFYSDVDGVCERCSSGNYLWPIISKCSSGSIGRSGFAAMEFVFQKVAGSYTRNVDMFIAPSKFSYQKHVEYGFPQNKIVHIPHGIDVERLRKYDEDQDAGYYLYFGRLQQRKGVITFLEAARRLPEVAFEIVGSAPDSSYVNEFLKKHRLQNVKLCGWLQGDDLWRKVAWARAVVVPSEWYEVVGLVVLEAGALGRPVIASRIGGIPEYIREGETGFLFEPGNADELCEQIRCLEAKPAEARTVGRAARGLIANEYSLELHENAIRRVYEEIAPL